MKKKTIALILVAALILSLAACGETAQITDEPAATDEQSLDEDDNVSSQPEEIIEEASEETTDEDEITEFLRSLYGQYGAYLEEGYDAEANIFCSPISGRAYISPYFTLADANGDNYDDLIVTGDLGLRNAKKSEVMFYDDNEMAFFLSSFDGEVSFLSEGCVIAINDDRDAASPTYYYDTVVFRLTPSTDDVSEAERVLAHYNTVNEEGDTPTETNTYYAGDTEITEDDFNAQYEVYDAAIIPLDYVEMSKDSIADEVPKF